MKNGEQETGVSVFFVDEGIDSGPILVQKRIPIGDLSLDQLIVKTKMIGMEAVAEALNKITEGSLQTIENNDEEMTYYTFPTAHDVREFRKRGKRFF